MWRVLAAIAAHGSLRQIDLAGFTSIDLDLVAAGVAARPRRPRDARPLGPQRSRGRRQAFGKGNALVARLIPLAREYEAAAIAGLSRERARGAQALPAPVYGNMKRRPASFATAAQ